MERTQLCILLNGGKANGEGEATQNADTVRNDQQTNSYLHRKRHKQKEGGIYKNEKTKCQKDGMHDSSQCQGSHTA